MPVMRYPWCCSLWCCLLIRHVLRCFDYDMAHMLPLIIFHWYFDNVLYLPYAVCHTPFSRRCFCQRSCYAMLPDMRAPGAASSYLCLFAAWWASLIAWCPLCHFSLLYYAMPDAIATTFAVAFACFPLPGDATLMPDISRWYRALFATMRCYWKMPATCFSCWFRYALRHWYYEMPASCLRTPRRAMMMMILILLMLCADAPMIICLAHMPEQHVYWCLCLFRYLRVADARCFYATSLLFALFAISPCHAHAAILMLVIAADTLYMARDIFTLICCYAYSAIIFALLCHFSGARYAIDVSLFSPILFAGLLRCRYLFHWYAAMLLLPIRPDADARCLYHAYVERWRGFRGAARFRCLLAAHIRAHLCFAILLFSDYATYYLLPGRAIFTPRRSAMLLIFCLFMLLCCCLCWVRVDVDYFVIAIYAMPCLRFDSAHVIYAPFTSAIRYLSLRAIIFRERRLMFMIFSSRAMRFMRATRQLTPPDIRPDALRYLLLFYASICHLRRHFDYFFFFFFYYTLFMPVAFFDIFAALRLFSRCFMLRPKAYYTMTTGAFTLLRLCHALRELLL